MRWFSKELVLEGTALAVDYGEITYRDLNGEAHFIDCWFHLFPHIRDVLHVGDHFVLKADQYSSRLRILSLKIIPAPTEKT